MSVYPANPEFAKHFEFRRPPNPYADLDVGVLIAVGYLSGLTADGWVTWRDINRHALVALYAPGFDGALDRLVARGALIVDHVGVSRYRLSGRVSVGRLPRHTVTRPSAEGIPRA